MEFVANPFEAKSEPSPRSDNLAAPCANAGAMVGVEGPSAERGEAAPADGLPCQYSNNCIGNESEGKPAPLSPYRQKSRHRLEMAIEWMVNKYDINHVGLLTLTFGVPGSGRGSKATWELRQQAKDLDFVQKRWHSFRSNIVAERYQDWICIFETHKDGVWHIHVVVATKADIRTGTDVETLSNYKLSFAFRRGKQFRNEALAAEWKVLRETACKYRFGRVELLPIKKTKEAFARYLGKYLAKTFNLVPPGRKNRLIRYSRGVGRHFTMHFSINSLGNLLYRTRLKIAGAMLDFRGYNYFADFFGPRWNYYLRDIIGGIPIPLRFAKGDFESGVAARALAQYGEDPWPFLDAETRKQMSSVYRMIWRKFEELALDTSAEARGQEAAPPEADNIDVGPLSEEDLVEDLFKSPDNPF